jgi:hypothetical protein
MTEDNVNRMRVILCRPGELARTIEMEDSLEAMQKMVGGRIEEYMPWEEEVAIVCNEEGKMMGLPLNRGIEDDEGWLQDIIAGDFFICYAPIESEKFLSIPPELEEKYLKKFEEPERFFRDGDEIRSEKYTPRHADHARDYAR